MLSLAELEAMNTRIQAHIDELNEGLGRGDIDCVDLAEAWLDAADSFQSALWSLYSLMEAQQ